MAQQKFTIHENSLSSERLIPSWLGRRNILSAYWTGEIRPMWKDRTPEAFGQSGYTGNLKLDYSPDALNCDVLLRPAMSDKVIARWPRDWFTRKDYLAFVREHGAFQHDHVREWLGDLAQPIFSRTRSPDRLRVHSADYSPDVWEFIPPEHDRDWRVRRHLTVPARLNNEQRVDLIDDISRSLLYFRAQVTVEYTR